MYYELYVDVFFLENFMMDYLLLLLVRKMMKCTATHGNLCLGAAIGSGLTCTVIIFLNLNTFIKSVLFHTVINTAMIRVGLKIKHLRSFVKALFLLYVGGFLLGGVLQFLNQYIRIGSLFFTIAALGYYIVSKIWDVLKNIQKIDEIFCEVDLYMGDKKCQVTGIIDTGNGLRDPLSKEPVSILDKKVAKQFLGETKLSQARYIPYHSIGKKEGVMFAIKIDKMCIFREQEIWIMQPLIGVSEETITAEGEYQMILNPNLL